MSHSLEAGQHSLPRNRRSAIAAGLNSIRSNVDVVIARWQTLTEKQAVLDGDGRTFAEIAAERLGQGENAGD